MLFVYCYNVLWRKCAVPKRAVRSDGVVLITPPFNKARLAFCEYIEIFYKHQRCHSCTGPKTLMQA